jgi:hypothetical protein
LQAGPKSVNARGLDCEAQSAVTKLECTDNMIKEYQRRNKRLCCYVRFGRVFTSALVLIAGSSRQIELCTASDVALSQAPAVPQVKSAKERVTKPLYSSETRTVDGHVSWLPCQSETKC